MREWHPGKAFVFDDTIEHEAWNDSDVPRAVLILDIWSPFVSKAERDARIDEVVHASHDLLLDVASDLDDEAAAAAEHALGLPTLYASGRAGIASTEQPADGEALWQFATIGCPVVVVR